jgi:hypothetical protein
MRLSGSDSTAFLHKISPDAVGSVEVHSGANGRFMTMTPECIPVISTWSSESQSVRYSALRAGSAMGS